LPCGPARIGCFSTVGPLKIGDKKTASSLLTVRHYRLTIPTAAS
jgi:hypothetical protein